MRISVPMGAVRVRLRGGAEDVFADEQIGGETDGVWDPRVTMFDFRYQVSVDRRLAVIVAQLFHDRRHSPDVQPVAAVEVATYSPSEWVSVTKS